jgi:hypothetical protein
MKKSQKQDSMKVVNIIAVVIVLTFVGVICLAIMDDRKWRKMKTYPVRYAYRLNGSRGLPSLVAEERDCITKIKIYYEAKINGAEAYVPTCPMHVIQLHDNEVHVLSVDSDSVYAEIAYFYWSRKGTEKCFTGYAVIADLHELPYNNNE